MSADENCGLLLHNSLFERCCEILATTAGSSLVSKIQQIKSAPGNGHRIQGTEIISVLEGKLYKSYIGGSGKYRLFYFFDPAINLVLVFHITTETRGNLDYSDIGPIVEAASAAVHDFEASGTDNFFAPSF